MHPTWSLKIKTFLVKQTKRTSEIPQYVTRFLDVALWFPLASEFTCILQTSACLWPCHTWLCFSIATAFCSLVPWGQESLSVASRPAHAVPWVCSLSPNCGLFQFKYYLRDDSHHWFQLRAIHSHHPHQPLSAIIWTWNIRRGKHGKSLLFGLRGGEPLRGGAY